MGFPNARLTNLTSGAAYTAATSLQSGSWQALQFITDTKLHTLTGNITGLANTDVGAAITIPAGLAVYGKFSALRLHSGSVITYLA
jgi:hypothetical protein